jgi:uncharacterized membrane protein YczE
MRATLLKPVRWQTFPGDFLRIQLGFALYAVSLALLIQANLGTNPWSVLTVALAPITGLSIGTLTIVIGLVVLLGAVLLREQIGWGTLGNIIFIGPYLDLVLRYLPSIENNIVLQGVMLLGGTLLMGLATAVYIGVDAGAGPRDSLMLALDRTTPLSLRVARGLIELLVVVSGWMLGGPLGVGTVIFALLIGPSVQWAFQWLNVPRSGH